MGKSSALRAKICLGVLIAMGEITPNTASGGEPDRMMVAPNTDTVGYSDLKKEWRDQERNARARAEAFRHEARRDRALNLKYTSLYRRNAMAWLDYRRSDLRLKVNEAEAEVADLEAAAAVTKQEYADIRIQMAEDIDEHIIDQAKNSLARAEVGIKLSHAILKRDTAIFNLAKLNFDSTQRLHDRQADSHEELLQRQADLDRAIAYQKESQLGIDDAEKHLAIANHNLERAKEKERRYSR